MDMSEILLKDLNEMAKENPTEMIRRAEESYHSKIGEIAARVVNSEDIRIVLLAGPSGSGKTTSANMLADAIRDRGEEVLVISLDDFYRNTDDPNYPRLASGEQDFETVEALDIPTLNETLADIAAGREFLVPKYDFKKSKRTEMRKYASMAHGCVIIEGLHALNPAVFSPLPKEKVLKIFISVSTNVNDGTERVISGRKMRFIRRMIRDSIYRATGAERTLEIWENVLHGEDKYLYPNRIYADVSFDTFHLFELSVTRRFVEKLISDELAQKNEYAKAVLTASRAAYPIDVSLVPESSLIREFIPGGKYEALY